MCNRLISNTVNCESGSRILKCLYRPKVPTMCLLCDCDGCSFGFFAIELRFSFGLTLISSCFGSFRFVLASFCCCSSWFIMFSFCIFSLDSGTSFVLVRGIHTDFVLLFLVWVLIAFVWLLFVWIRTDFWRGSLRSPSESERCKYECPRRGLEASLILWRRIGTEITVSEKRAVHWQRYGRTAHLPKSIFQGSFWSWSIEPDYIPETTFCKNSRATKSSSKSHIGECMNNPGLCIPFLKSPPALYWEMQQWQTTWSLSRTDNAKRWWVQSARFRNATHYSHITITLMNLHIPFPVAAWV